MSSLKQQTLQVVLNRIIQNLIWGIPIFCKLKFLYEHTFIVHYYVKINDGSEFQDKKCCLSLVTAMIRGEARTALIPEKCEHNCCDNF
jgi:hypothetical protein